MMTAYDIENSRRSAAMAPLSQDETMRLLDTCTTLLRERDEIVALLAELPRSFAEVRGLLNRLQGIVS
jgi:hypothetical protein